MRTLKNPEERRNEIVDAAEILFTTKGFAKTTVNDILQKVGIAKGTFYYYFESKVEVLDAIVERFINAEISAAQTIAANPSLNAPEKIFQILMGPKPNQERKEEVIEQLHQVDNAEMHQKSLVETIKQLTPVLTVVIEQGIKEGSFHTPFPKETVEILLVSSQFLFDEGIFTWEPEELTEKAVAFSYIAEKALGAEQGTFSFIAKMLETKSEEGRRNDE